MHVIETQFPSNSVDMKTIYPQNSGSRGVAFNEIKKFEIIIDS